MTSAEMRQRPACRPGVIGRSDRVALSGHDGTATDRRQGPTVTGAFVVDLTDLHPWDHWQDEIREAAHRLADVPRLPAGAQVVIRPGEFRPFGDVFRGESIDHLAAVRIECGDAALIRRWVAALRGDV